MDLNKIITDERSLKIFNSPVEIGLRTLFVLSAFENISLSMEKLVCFDYFLIHAGDISNKQKSIHPKYPYRSSEIIIKRELILNSIKLLISKQLILTIYSLEGIQYKITEIGLSFIKYFHTNYANNIRELSIWIMNTYNNYNEDQLYQLINNNLQKWGSEFTTEVKFSRISKIK